MCFINQSALEEADIHFYHQFHINTLRKNYQNGHNFEMTFSNAFSCIKLNLYDIISLILFPIVHDIKPELVKITAKHEVSHYLNQC